MNKIKKKLTKIKWNKVEGSERMSKDKKEIGKGRRYMAVSKASIPYIDIEIGEKFKKDIEKTQLNTKLIRECKGLMKELLKQRRK